MKKQILSSIAVFIFIVSFISAQSYVFKEDEYVNYRFRCFDANNSYCNNATQLIISVEYPNGSNAVDNRSMTHNPTYFNVSLPTDTIGSGYMAIINSPTSNGTVTEFSYDVTYNGEKVSLSNIILAIVYMVVALIFMGFGFGFGSDHWIIKTFFNFCAIIMGVLAINTGKIIASESNNLSRMGEVGLIVMYAVLSIFLLYIFVFMFIDIINAFRKKKEVRWDYA